VTEARLATTLHGVDRCCATVSARKPDFASLPVECFYFYAIKTQTVFILKKKKKKKEKKNFSFIFLFLLVLLYRCYIDPLNRFTGFNPRAFKVFPVNFVSRDSENLFKYRKI
jgi:hypothetical protein